MGPKVPRSTVLSVDEETLVIEFRRRTLLPLDDCLYALQATIPYLTRSSLHRLLQRHGINRVPTTAAGRPRQAFKAYPVGYLHIDLAEVWTEEGKLYLFVAIDRISKFAFAELHDRATRRIAADFLRRLLEHVPYRIHTVLTDNGFQFTEPRGGWRVGEIQEMLASRQRFRAHAFDYACPQHGIGHRLTKFNHPWTNGQVERMNRTIKEATVRAVLLRHACEPSSTCGHLPRCVQLRESGSRAFGPHALRADLSALDRTAQRFRLNPLHHMAGLNI
jgi:transposase InsO family protein